MRLHSIYPRCKMLGLCRKYAAGIQDNGDGTGYPLCREHHELYDFLGRKRFEERFGLWLFPSRVRA